MNFRQDLPEKSYARYKIVVYTDSVGCTSCKLQLYKWNTFIEEVSRNGEVDFYFYFQSKDKRLLSSILSRENFKLPIYLDKEDEFRNANKISNEMQYQCFLLDADDKVVLIGNPVLNSKIWELYKEVLGGKDTSFERNLTTKTTVEIIPQIVELDSLLFRKESIAIFTFTNTGDTPLCIYDITTTCGCTVPEWNKELIRPKEKSAIKVKVIPDALGYFDKKINVFCNIKGGSIRLTVRGVVRNNI